MHLKTIRITFFIDTSNVLLGVRAVAQPLRQRRRRAGHEEHRRTDRRQRVRHDQLLRRLVPLQQHALAHLGRVRRQGQERGRPKERRRRRIFIFWKFSKMQICQKPQLILNV